MDTIINYKKNYNSISLYPNVIKTKFGYNMHIYNDNELLNIKNQLKNMTNQKIKSWEQNEIYYNNLVSITKQFSNNFTEINYYMESPNDFIKIDNHLLILKNLNYIDKNQFPSLVNYDNIINKSFESYNIDNINIIILTQNNKSTIYFNVINIEKTDIVKIQKIINEIF